MKAGKVTPQDAVLKKYKKWLKKSCRLHGRNPAKLKY
jgi:hypothetical protein